jgi:hypothetical protein
MQRWDPIVIVFLAFTLFWVKSPIRVRMSLSCGLSVIRGQFCESLLITAFLSGLSRLPMLRHLVISTMDNEHQSAAANGLEPHAAS